MADLLWRSSQDLRVFLNFSDLSGYLNSINIKHPSEKVKAKNERVCIRQFQIYPFQNNQTIGENGLHLCFQVLRHKS